MRQSLRSLTAISIHPQKEVAPPNGTSFALSYQREVVRSLHDGATPPKTAAVSTAYNASLLARGVDSGDSAAAQRK